MGDRVRDGGSSDTNDDRAARSRDQQFRALVEAVEEYAIFRLDTDGHVVSWNTGAERLKGYTRAEILGEHFSTFYTPEARNDGVPERNLARAAEDGSTEDEGWRVRAEGSRFWANVTITAIRNDDGEIEGFAKVTRDMTDRHQVEQERELHLSVSHSIAEARSLEEGLQAAMKDVCEYTDWDLGQAWSPNEAGAIERLPLAYVQDPSFGAFEAASREYSFGPGEGIPGRVLESAEPVWFPDVTSVPESVYPRTDCAAESGIQAGLGVPVLVDGEVVVVLEFYLAGRREKDEHLVELVQSVTADLGSLIARKQTEDDLNRERELLTEVMAAAPVGISVFTPDGTVERMNERARALRGGGDLGDPVQTTQIRDFHDEYGNPVPPEARPLARVVDTGEAVYDWVGRIELSDDSWRWLSVYAAPILDESGAIDRVVVVEEDITELRERYHAITEAINDVIVTIDTESIIQSVNAAVEDVFGYAPAELIGSSLRTLMPPEFREQHRAAVERYLETGERELDWDYIELPGQRADGSEVPLGVSFSEIEYRGEQYFTGVVRDISERKRYERRLEESNERLEQFAYAASHDLQEPLRMVTSYLQLLEDRYADALDEDAREFIDYALEGAQRMREMIEALLQYSRVETQGNPFEPVDLETVLDDVLTDLERRIEDTDADVTLAPLPTVRGDRSQLRAVFQNLIGNAIEYSGDEHPQIHVSTERNGEYWRLAVADEGIGIESEDQERIFQVFQRLHSRGEHEGTGIGLSLCKRIVERHDGDIWVDSEPGEGTTFYCTLPAVDESVEADRYEE
jgi:PAS domain S-box-containing protein